MPSPVRLSLPATNAPLTLDSKVLFQGTREIRIKHNSETYRLTITKLGKLILTK